LRRLAKKYSEFINFPIWLKVQKEVSKEVPLEEEEILEEEEEFVDEDDDLFDELEEFSDEEFIVEDTDVMPKTKTVREVVWDWERVNDVKAIWYRPKEDIEEEEYTNFYKSISKDYADPLAHIHFIAEGEVQFRSILYIPEHAPYD
jgi:heat shock protein beta